MVLCFYFSRTACSAFLNRTATLDSNYTTKFVVQEAKHEYVFLISKTNIRSRN